MRELQPDHVLQEVIGVLRDKCPRLEPEGSWADLKAPLFDLLRELGTKAGFKVWHADDTGTYLWDISWTHEPHPPYWVELVGEIELTDQYREEILHDFYKVLDAKARLKIFVAAAPSRVKAEQLKNDIEWAVENQRFRLPEERIVAILIIDGGKSDWDTAETRVFDGSGPYGRWREGWELLPLVPQSKASR